MPATKVAEFLEKWRTDRRLSKAAFARDLGFSTRQRYTQILKADPDLATLRQMASALKVSVSELIGETPLPPVESEVDILKQILSALHQLTEEIRGQPPPLRRSGGSR